ncbi:NUDIX domain-containing protein [Nocardia sp. CNY236]|uniref:NUDIX hydrolase n=1 Tax=Nocardia sp. CNY236 TaxID=1169152 RepID=UPI000403180A|nr:NUDIX domain-containing protein [Nocardia sp. CNY236]
MPYTTVIDVLLLLSRDDRVLLARRHNTGYADGQWNLPSGKLEDGEDVVDAIIRETHEEIGIELDRDEVRFVSSIHYKAPEGHSRIGFVFTVERWNGEPANREPDKCSALGWFPLDQLPTDTVPYTAACVELFQRGEHFGLPGWEAATRPLMK